LPEVHIAFNGDTKEQPKRYDPKLLDSKSIELWLEKQIMMKESAVKKKAKIKELVASMKKDVEDLSKFRAQLKEVLTNHVVDQLQELGEDNEEEQKLLKVKGLDERQVITVDIHVTGIQKYSLDA